MNWQPHTANNNFPADWIIACLANISGSLLSEAYDVNPKHEQLLGRGVQG